MTVGEALARAEELRPGCQITVRTRQRWLVELDGMLREKFFKNCPGGSYDAVGADRAWNDQLAEDAELLCQDRRRSGRDGPLCRGAVPI